ncbi:type II secretion system protein E [Bacillus cereus]|uniref:Type II secretion system protein E n=1 Tax=Bacillus cereus TaxID=1396 RepID=A0A2B0N1C4_BACCE|nr:type II secretion system protein E [Bacillus cereus]
MSLFRKGTSRYQSVVNQQASQLYENPRLDYLVDHYKKRLLQMEDLAELTQKSPVEMRLEIERRINRFMTEEKIILQRHEREFLMKRLIDESVGFGPLEPLLHDSTITEILVNGPKEVFVERGGRLQKVDLVFKNEQHLRHIIDRVVAPLGRRIDESSPMVDARLPDGSRVNAVIPPVSLNGTLISIRKFRKDPFTINELLQFETLDTNMATFLEAIVSAKSNILISGGTGSGKTTLLNVLAAAIPEHERVITIEDSAELRLNRGSVIGLEARPANVEEKGEITIRQLVRNALRMRPDRIIVGEVRGGEAFDMLQAMNTGHEGSLTTVHANSPYDALGRVEGMVVMAGLDLPSHVIRSYLVGAIDFIVQGERLSDGRRRLMSISEITLGADGEANVQEIFRFRRTGIGENGEVLGRFEPTGAIPSCLNKLEVYGFNLDHSMFENDGMYSLESQVMR